MAAPGSLVGSEVATAWPGHSRGRPGVVVSTCGKALGAARSGGSGLQSLHLRLRSPSTALPSTPLPSASLPSTRSARSGSPLRFDRPGGAGGAGGLRQRGGVADFTADGGASLDYVRDLRFAARSPPYQNKKRSGKAQGLALPEIRWLLGTRMAGRHGAEQGFSAAVQPAKIAIGWCRIDAEALPGDNMRLN